MSTNETAADIRRPRYRRAFRTTARAIIARCVFAACAFLAPSLYGQSITPIGDRQGADAFQGISTPATKLAMLADPGLGDDTVARGSWDSQTFKLNIAAPKDEPREIDGLSERIAVRFPKQTDANAATQIELLCSDDSGANWRSYAVVFPGDSRDSFLFEAPASGEYWLALRTHFRNGKSALSSTRAYRFIDPNESFELRDDSLDEQLSFAPTIEDEPERPQTLVGPERDEEAFVLNNVAVDEQLPDEPTPPTTPNVDATANPGDEQTPPKVVPHPGKLKSVAFGKENGSDRLMVTVRWFRPEEIDEEFRIPVKAFSIERAPSPKGPWTIIGEDLDVTEKGYAWIATADEMAPFYARTVVIDADGNVWKDASPAAVDVSAPGVRAALGAVKTPIPFPEPKKSEKDSDSSENSFISNTASKDETAVDDRLGEDKLVSPRDLDRNSENSKDGKLVSGVQKTEAIAPARRRVNVPAPTNPNEFQLNPLFTQGFGVLYHAAQTRRDADYPAKKRSIFTPPERAQRVASVRPAERRRSPEQIAAIRAREARMKLAEQAKYAREHEMETFEQKPELMEGRMFYLDSNGNLTTTPPPEMQQALGSNVDMIAQGWTPSESSATPAQQGDSAPIYMPRDTEAYDASARSGAAFYSNNQYPAASNAGNSPINARFSTSPAPANVGNDAPITRTIPETSYSPTINSAPSNFPPQPRISY